MEIKEKYNSLSHDYKGQLFLPCKQWICDTCRTLIESPEDGDLQYLNNRNDHTAFSFKIIHSKLECDQYNSTYHLDVDYCFHYLQTLQGKKGFENFLDIMQYEDIATINGYFKTMRRLFVPYYEQARLFFKQELKDNFFKQNGFEEPYSTEALKALIAHYISQ